MPDLYHAHSHPSPAREKAIAKSRILRDKKSNNHPLASFCLLPTNVRFDVQHSDEHILLLLRQHFIVNFGWIVLSVVLLLLPSFMGFLSFLTFLPPALSFILTLVWYLFVLGYAFERFVVWYFNIYIVTNERVIDIDFFSLLFKRVSEAKLENIQDLTGASSGVIQSLFNYGDVLIQTAAEVTEIEFEKVPYPEVVTKLISELIDKSENSTRGKK